MKIGLEPSSHSQTVQESATNDKFNKNEKYTVVSGANRDEMKRMDFPIALFFGWEKVTCTVQKY